MNTALHKNYTRKNQKLPMYANTMDGLHEWYNKKCKALGWMVIAAAKGYDYKVANYKKSLAHLLESIEHVMTEYTDPDRVHDLEVIHMNAKVLKEFAEKNL